MAEFFGRDVKTIGKHINNALKEELAVGANFATTPSATSANFATVQLRESTCSILERDEVGKDFLRTDNYPEHTDLRSQNATLKETFDNIFDNFL